jgi:hypothetical protein
MAGKRKHYTATFKAQVDLAALTGGQHRQRVGQPLRPGGQPSAKVHTC